MGEGKRPKGERSRKTDRPTKAERRAAKQTKSARKAAARAGAAPEALSTEERIERRLARLEEAVAAQSDRSDELLEKIDEMLHERPKRAS